MTTASCYRPSSTSSKPPSSSRWQSCPDIHSKEICPESPLFVHTCSKLVNIDISHCAKKNVKSCFITIPLQDQIMRFIEIESVDIDNKQAKMLWPLFTTTKKCFATSLVYVNLPSDDFLLPNRPSQQAKRPFYKLMTGWSTTILSISSGSMRSYKLSRCINTVTQRNSIRLQLITCI